MTPLQTNAPSSPTGGRVPGISVGRLGGGGAERRCRCLAGELAWQRAGEAHSSKPLPRTLQGTHSIIIGKVHFF